MSPIVQRKWKHLLLTYLDVLDHLDSKKNREGGLKYWKKYLYFSNVQTGAAGYISVLLYLQRGDNPAGDSLPKGQSVQVLQSNVPQSDSDRLRHHVQVGWKVQTLKSNTTGHFSEMIVIYPVLTTSLCVLTKWTRHMGFCITYTSLLMKTWRSKIELKMMKKRKKKHF